MSNALMYQVMYMVTIFISVWAAVITWRRRHAPGGLALFLMLLSIIEWNVSGFMQVVVKDMGGLIFWSAVSYIGSTAALTFFLIFVLDFTHHQKWLTRRNYALLSVIPVVTVILAFTNHLHRLIWSGFSPSPDGVNMIYLHGPWFWFVVFYINCVMFSGTFLLFRFIQRSLELYRAQSAGLMIATFFPWLGMTVYALGFNPFPGVDIVAISFAFTGITLSLTFARFSLLDVLPIAREFLVDNMPDGLFVVDGSSRVVDINPAALRIFQINPALKWIGMPSRGLLADFPELARELEKDGQVEIEWEHGSNGNSFFDVQIFPLHDRSGRLSGKSMVLRDITRLKKAERKLQAANLQMNEKLVQIEKLKNDLRDQSIHDALTGLLNRRYFDEIILHEIARAELGEYFLSMVILDIDHFKEWNDNYGHACGDTLLRAMGALFRATFRVGDVLCRYGGDEFLLLLPETTAENVYQRLEAFRKLCLTLPVEMPEGAPAFTFSAGIAVYPLHARSAEDIFRAADQALYQAKAQGRNRTCFPK